MPKRAQRTTEPPAIEAAGWWERDSETLVKGWALEQWVPETQSWVNLQITVPH